LDLKDAGISRRGRFHFVALLRRNDAMGCAGINVTSAPDRVLTATLRFFPGDLDYCFSRFDQGPCIRKRSQQQRLET
jgi:hypothetical protein